ncbi:MAG: 3-phosphoshikimate 1-carboxyvinyltransferase [Planctomycetota bacterium]|nr:3-phosphoshikimate 1-carboxyvinyltransferase [Planctomycetota bacterium]MDA1261835.1 3-phosphoshikimate 1-carboxyvinyltransferase [Planctomycetota bacterium]
MNASSSSVPAEVVAISQASRPFNVTIEPPGSKSETNRFLMLGALSKGISKLVSPLHAVDTGLFMDALRAIGVAIDTGESWANIHGCDGRFTGGASVHLGDGGTPTRFMMAIAALARKPVLIDGSPRMRERPIAEGVDLLRALGCKIEYAEEEGRLPVRVGGGRMPLGGKIEVGRTASSQFISAILMLAPRLEKGIDLFVNSDSLTSPSYVELTLHAMKKWGIPFDVFRGENGQLTRVTVPHIDMSACSVAIEPDASSAVYFLGAASIVRDARVSILGLPRLSRQPDAACLPAFVSMGAQEWSSSSGMGIEGTATLNGIDVDASHWPDGALCVAAVGALAKGRTRIRGLETLKVKESNRVQVLAEELTKMGCRIETTPSSITIEPDFTTARPILIDPRGDHRIAMTFAVLGLSRPGISIGDPRCVAKSYPNFWRDFALLTEAPR